ncbi:MULTISPECIES: GNAT family N-acetyltransferase [unclassified Paenibacillus]|uniref:GNAT family N-acetyltransferase n=1 Tax=unclassified Paenibacillus TaxID=185978 RepID=UPI002406CFD0|nr:MULTISPECIES: GNAT family N-acetyltransferase [unclassified Paenibacillus]MDF9842113.1 GNAT superfamily N-acetyltransferase [Paenibacillus sp. PastF-2]MDF9848633.1 GNAT superfamily N-acetyltransferase [Paenibacillus sp. PastM-2]MDF9855202.1 GNAT superfamily N-acetyltransferase [Paenibacillus sp. PastF-1]MDH6480472.1 GNAT superfamily N-acetyltransferase [Paenibacillus sp. PastH-2]MDH6507900.1 GNAT superfamily N-acetyltransferase [Paenibacillus sp. PastM-3]
MLTYRRLEAEDLNTICTFPRDEEELYCVSPKFSYPLTPEQIMKVLEGRFNPTVIVAEDRRQPLAYANLYDKDEEQHTCWLGNVVVRPGYRGSGVASFLLESMMQQASNEHDIQTLKLYCHNINTRALLFYCKHGFTPCGSKVMTYFNRGKIVGIEMFKKLD